MSVIAHGRMLPRRNAFVVAVALGAVGTMTAAGFVGMVAGRGPSPGDIDARPRGLAGEREAFLAYASAVDAAVKEGGFAVTQGMQPGVADIAEGALPDDTLVTMASGWLATMQRVRADLATVDPPVFLRTAAGRFDEAFAAYVEVADALLAAARAAGVGRARLIELVPPLGQRADDLWDAASAELERHRTRLGLADAAGPPDEPTRPTDRER